MSNKEKIEKLLKEYYAELRKIWLRRSLGELRDTMFDNTLFRPANVGVLMQEGQGTTYWEKVFSNEARAYLLEIYIFKLFGRKKDIDKGNTREEESIELLSEYMGHVFFKNTKKFMDNYLFGAPDIIETELIIEVETLYDIFTFAKAELTKQYYCQLQCYMHLTGKKKAKLAYCLTSSSDEQIEREKYYRSYKNPYSETSEPELYEQWNEEQSQKIEKLMRYDDMYIKERVKIYDVEYDPGYIAQLQERIQLARLWLKEYKWNA
jgi:hypothetical protein